MKKLSALVMLALLGVVSVGCEPAAPTAPVNKPAAGSTPASDHMTSDSGEETPAAPAAETKPEPKPEEPPAGEPGSEEKKSEEKPADAPKS